MPKIKTERFEMRVAPEFLERVDQWRSIQRPILSRAKAVEALTNIGLDETAGVEVAFPEAAKRSKRK